MACRRRRFLQMIAAAGVLPALPQIANARTYPSQRVRIIVGFPVGGPLDIVARLFAKWLSSRLSQEFAVENIVGASGNVATGMVVKAPADGYTLLLCGPVNTINTTLYGDKLDFDFGHDITPVASIARVPLVVEVHPSVSARSVPELIVYARSNPRKLKVAFAGSGTPQHVAIELFNMMSGVDMTLVPYPGSAAALADLLGGQAQVMFDPLPSSMPHIRAGKLIPVAVTSVERSAVLPDIPVVSDFLPGYEAGSWFGVGAPRGTPKDIIDKLNKAVNLGLTDQKIMGRLSELGAVPMPGAQNLFAEFIDNETKRYRRVIRLANIKAR